MAIDVTGVSREVHARQRPLLTRGMRYREWLSKADMPTPKLTNEIITAAIQGFEFQKTSIDGKVAELRAMLPGGPGESAATPEPTKRRPRKMSAAARARIGEAQRKRWAASKVQSEPAALELSQPKGKLSAAGRAAIVAATKKRWALKRAEAAKSKPSPKKAAVRKSVVKKTAPAVVQSVTETGGQ